MVTDCALLFVLLKAGNIIAARIPRIATTTNTSTSVSGNLRCGLRSRSFSDGIKKRASSFLRRSSESWSGAAWADLGSVGIAVASWTRLTVCFSRSCSLASSGFVAMAARQAAASSSGNSPRRRARRRISISSCGVLGDSGFMRNLLGNPKFEIRNSKEIRSPKSEDPAESGSTYDFGPRISGFLRISDFGFRISESWHHPTFGEFIGNDPERVVKQIIHVAGLQAGAFTDFLVGKVFGKFQPDQFAAA